MLPDDDAEAPPQERDGHPTDDSSWEETRERFIEAAIQAEYETGEREDTEAEARRHILVRIAIIIAGSAVLFAGLLMLVLPGPGIVAVIAGLTILSTEVAWAERMLEYAKEKARVEELKQKPAWVQNTMWLFSIVAVAGSVAYFTLR